MTVSMRVYGTPVAKGSMRAFMHNGKPILTTSAKGLGEWTQKIAAAANGKTVQMESPVLVSLYFFMPRPKTLPKKVKHMVKRPDVDKLVRAVLDALTGIAYHDDSQVVELGVTKKYATDACPPGVDIRIDYLNEGE